MTKRKVIRTDTILGRIVIAVYTITLATAAIMYYIGYNPIIPSDVERDYPVLEGVPYVSQKSIDRAVHVYDIKVPLFTLHPSLDIDMPEGILGQARSYILIHLCIPTIGPGSFTSWGKLGAVIAHEVEVHCNQNWWRHAIDLFLGVDTMPQLEREAYMYMLLDSKRFNLTPQEREDIFITMLLLYPNGDENEQRPGIEETEERTHGSSESP